MRHLKKGRALNRTQSHRRALLSNLITSLFLHEKIRTTVAKAKETRPLAEKLITFAKRGDLHARRQVLKLIRDKEVVRKLFDTLGVRFKERPGGYTRIVKLGNRLGDNAPMAFLELIPEESQKKAGARKRRRRMKKKEAEEAARVQEAPKAAQAGVKEEETLEVVEAPEETQVSQEEKAPAGETRAEGEKPAREAGEKEDKEAENKDKSAS